MKDKTIYLDKAGYEEYLSEIEQLKAKLNENSSVKSESYKSQTGDGWHDNFAFEDAKRQEIMIMKMLEEKLKGLRNIKIIKQPKSKFKIGDTLLIKMIIDKEETLERIKLTGNSSYKEEEDIKMVTLNSPLAKAIMKHKIGDTFTYAVAGNEITVEIIAGE